MTTIPRKNDVLFGRGSAINEHPGNQRFRSMVDAQKEKFAQLKRRKDKRAVAVTLVNEIGNLDPPGRFLTEDQSGIICDGDGRGSDAGNNSTSEVLHPLISPKIWVIVGEDKALNKTLKRLREKEKGGGVSVSAGSREKIEKKQSVNHGSPKTKNDAALSRSAVGHCDSSSSGHSHHDNADQQLRQKQGNNGFSANCSYPDDKPTCEVLDIKTSPTCNADAALEEVKVTSSALEIQEEQGSLQPAIPLSKKHIGKGSINVQQDINIWQQPTLELAMSEETSTESLQPEVVSNQDEDSNELRRSSSTARHGSLDEALDLFLTDFSTQHDEDEQLHQLHELTMRQWIEIHIPKHMDETGTHRQSSDQVSEYVKSALPIALELTAFLIEAEKDEQNGQGNPIPLASIAAGNVLIRSKNLERYAPADGKVQEVVEYAWIMSCFGENLDAGGVMSRLSALGGLLYELFTGKEPPIEENTSSNFKASSNNMLSINSINLNTDCESSYRPPKKSQRQPLHSEDMISACLSSLEGFGIPWSIIALVGNLLDSSNGDFCGDGAYTSLNDLRADIQLLMDDPSRFLDNIETNPMPQLSICNKIYGRDEESKRLEELYHNEKCSGVLIKGGAGVGKSKLALHVVQKLTNQSNGYFLGGKFDQSKHIKPLSTIGNIFNLLCESFSQDATPTQLKSVEEALESGLGNQATLLAGVVPNLTKLMPSCTWLGSSSGFSSNCVSSALSMRFLVGELLSVLASYSRPISLFLDDLQWADSASLLLVGNLISSFEGSSKSVFFIFCYRDDEVGQNSAFESWLRSISMFSLDEINLENMIPDSVNKLVSEALRLSPRITRPLASVLHHKTRGNPLFLKQLMDSLWKEQILYFQFNPTRWAWNLSKIMDWELADNVIELLMKDMQRLPSDLQLGLKLSSCIGSQVSYTIIDILSKDLKVDLMDIMQRVSISGFMNDAGGTVFTFAHDKIQQAAYELMKDYDRRENHMRFGLAICSYALNDADGNDVMFFTAVNQINHAGPGVIISSSQKSTIAALNLKAGRRAITVSDFSTAFKMLEHGISFLENDHWLSHYTLSLDLFDAAVEAACVLNKSEAVAFYSKQLDSHAKCFNEKLNCMYSKVKLLRHAELLQESMESTFTILTEMGEELPRPMGDSKLSTDMQAMTDMLRNTSDDSIFNMQHTTNKKIITLMKIYAHLINVLHFFKPSLICSVSLRMVELSLTMGLSSTSPPAFACYGEVLASLGYITDGCRLGRLALKLLEKEGLATAWKSSVICMVYTLVLWASEPLQSIADAHLLGLKAGKQAGDFLHSTQNSQLAVTTKWLSGESLNTVTEMIRNFLLEMLSQNTQALWGNSVLLHSQCLVLREGLYILDEGRVDAIIPTERELLANQRFHKNKNGAMANKIHQLIRAFLFCQLDAISLDSVHIWDEICEKKHLLRPLLTMGIFFEGLTSFELARKTSEPAKWVKNGENILSKVKSWNKHSSWNFQNKMFLLEAEKMHTLGEFDEAASFYERAIQSAREHKFIHEEGIASELAGMFHYKTGSNEKSLDFFLHSVLCYEKWGALAVAKRVENFIENNYDPDSTQPRLSNDILNGNCVFNKGYSKKRQERE